MSVSAPSSDPNLEDFLRHGGRLAAARRAFPDAPTPWLDLSTGINPRPWKGARATAASLTRLPDPSETAALEAAAAAASKAVISSGSGSRVRRWAVARAPFQGRGLTPVDRSSHGVGASGNARRAAASRPP